MLHSFKRISLFIISVSISVTLFAQRTSTTALFNKYEKIQCKAPVIPNQSSHNEVIIVSSQKDFSNIQEAIEHKISSGVTNIEVRIKQGQYYFTDGQISYKGINASNVSLTLSGEDATLIAAGSDFRMRKPFWSKKSRAAYTENYPYDDVLLDESLNELSSSGDVERTDTLLEVVNEKERICRIHTNKGSLYKDGKYIIVTTWFTSVQGPILDVKGDWIYFKSSSLQYNDNYKCYNINYDYGYAKQMPRYIVFNDPTESFSLKGGKIFSNSNSRTIHQCEASSFLTLQKSQFNRITLKGLSFVGAANGESLISLRSSKAGSVEIENCSFRSLKNKVIDVYATNNVYILGCEFSDCYSTCVYSANGTKNTQVVDCVFKGNGRDFLQHHCVWCIGEDYYIANNVFRNFSYAAIRTGVIPWDKKEGVCSGIIEHNEIFYDREYYDSYQDHTLMDSGAIYVSTRNDNTIIRYNYIHDYVGMKDNRGIFCDTGTQNTRIYGNIVLNIPNSYTIELWRVASSERWEKDANDGNAVFQNILGGKYRFDGKEKAHSNVAGKNYIVFKGSKPRVVQNMLTFTEADDYITCEDPTSLSGIKRMSAIKASLVYPHLKKYFDD